MRAGLTSPVSVISTNGCASLVSDVFASVLFQTLGSRTWIRFQYGQRFSCVRSFKKQAASPSSTEAQAIFVVGADAFLLRENSDLQFKGTKDALIDSMRLLTGAVLSVFGSGAKQVATPDASFGIRGTGLYVAAQGERTYGCTCYGEVLISAADDAKVNERIVSKHHDAPRYIYPKGAAQRIVPAPFVNHTDVELALIEALVGRTTPFALFDEDYGGTRRY